MWIDAEYMDQLQKTNKECQSLNRSMKQIYYLKIIPAANAPSEINIGSKVCHCSLGYQGSNPSLYSLFNNIKSSKSLNKIKPHPYHNCIPSRRSHSHPNNVKHVGYEVNYVPQVRYVFLHAIGPQASDFMPN